MADAWRDYRWRQPAGEDGLKNLLIGGVWQRSFRRVISWQRWVQVSDRRKGALDKQQFIEMTQMYFESLN